MPSQKNAFARAIPVTSARVSVYISESKILLLLTRGRWDGWVELLMLILLSSLFKCLRIEAMGGADKDDAVLIK